MSRSLSILALVAAFFSVLAACGSPFVTGWRDDEKAIRTDQEKCEAMKGYQWLNGSCQKEGTFNLDGVGEADCKKVADAVWKDNRCTYFKELTTAADCASVGWTWHKDQCTLPAEAQCLADPASDWVVDHCVLRPTLALTGQTTQALAIGGTFQAVKLELSAGAAAGIENQTCSDFFVLSGDTVTSAPATGAASCEADVYALANGAKSQPVRLVASVDKGFLSYCKQFENQAAARQERLLARTVFLLKAATKKATCDEAAAELAKVTNLEITNSAIVDLRPLSGLTQLTVLNLEGNEVVDLTPVAYLPNLTVIGLAGNPIAQAAKTEANCPTNAQVNFAVSDFCLDQ